MQKPKFNVLSPDGFAITHDPFDSLEDALNYVPIWCKSFEFQGYYLDGRRFKIPLDELPDRLDVVMAEPDEEEDQ